MKRQLFRQEALDRLASPDRLDQLMPLTNPRAWIALAAGGLILLFAVLWGIFGTITETVDAEGVFTRAGGVTTVTAPADGRLHDLDVEVGDKVEKGQVLARLVGSGSEKAEAGQPILSPLAGRVLAIPSVPGLLTKGTPLFRLESLDDPLLAIVYVTATDGERIYPKMDARLTLGGEKSQSSDFYPGKVVRVSRYPATQDELMRIVQNTRRADRLAQRGPLLEIVVELDKMVDLYSGTPCQAQIVVGRRRPIQLVLPFPEQKGGQ